MSDLTNLILNELMEDVIPADVLAQIAEMFDDDEDLVMNFENKQSRGNTPSRTESFYEVTVQKYSFDQFKEHFRMTRTTFENLMQVVAVEVTRREEPIKNVCVEKKLLFTIWILSKPESFSSVGDRFNIAKSSGNAIFFYIVEILSSLMQQYIKWPTIAQQHASALYFEEKSGIPGVIGAIDGCHIPIKQPEGNASDYYNRKQFHSIILQGVCNQFGLFTDVYIGKPGRMHDARVYKCSPLYKKIMEPGHDFVANNHHLIGDSAYPLSVFLLTPYRDNGHLTTSQIRYNVKFSSIRSVIERAFGRLKGKFRRLKYVDIKSPVSATFIVTACCMLHNFILSAGEVDNDDLEPEEDDIIFDPNTENLEVLSSRESREGAIKRDSIKNIL